MRLGCVVMASGEGKRFRASGGVGYKLLAAVDGEPLVVRTVRSVPAELFDVVVVSRWDGVTRAVEKDVPGARVVRPSGPARSDTVRAGLAAGVDAWEGCLFLPGDQPLVSRRSFEALFSAFCADPACVYRLSWGGAAAAPVLFSKSCFLALMGLTGKDGGASILKTGDVPVACIEAAAAHELWDVDTVGDLARIEACLGATMVACISQG